MDPLYEAAGPELEPKKKRSHVFWKILGVLLICFAIFLTVSAFSAQDSGSDSAAPIPFDPYTQEEGRQYLEFNMLTDPVATFTLGENHGIYIAFQADSASVYPYLVCLSQKDFQQFQEIYDFTFDDRDISQAPGTGTVYGYAVEIDDDLRDYTIEYFNQLFSGITITESDFADYFGEYYLDATLVRSAGSSAAPSGAMLAAAAVLFLLGLALLLWRDKKAATAQPAVQAAPAGGDGSAVSDDAGQQPAWELPARSNPALGILGACLGSLVGAVIWILLFRAGYLVGIAGYLAVFCAIAGYTKLGGGTVGKAGTMLCVLIAVIAMVLSNCVAFSWVIADAVNEATPGRSSIAYILSHFPEMMETLELWGDFAADLAIGLVLALIAGFSSIIRAFKKRK